MKLFTSCAVFFFAVFHSGIPGFTAEPPDYYTKSITLQSGLEKFIRSYGTKGCFHSFVAAVTVDGGNRFVYAYNTDTSASYRLASVTKMFTMTAVMQLAERKQINIDDPISKYLPGVQIEKEGLHSPPVTIRHLLSHSSGLPDIRYYRPPYNSKVPGALTNIPGQIYPAGVHYRYANHGYVILGMLVEKVSGLTLDKYFAGNIFSPAGFKNAKTQSAILCGADGIFLSINDLERFAYLWLHDGRSPEGIQVINPETIQQVLSEQLYIPDAAAKKYVGLGWQIRKNGSGVITFFHIGGASNVAAWVQMFPQQHCAVMYLGNPPEYTPETSEFIEGIQNRLAELASAMSGTEKKIGVFHPTLADNAMTHKYPGKYRSLLEGYISEVYLQGSSLYIKNYKENARLYPVTTNIYTGAQGELWYDFIFKKGGSLPEGLATYYGYFERIDGGK